MNDANLMRKVLVIAWYSPPFGGGGVQRTVKFVKYLPQFGWQPVVLTGQEKYSNLFDPSLAADVPPETPVYRTPALLLPAKLPWRLRHFITRWLLVVDQELGWLPFAVKRGLEIIKQEQIDAIYTTSAPYTDHLIGLQLKKKTGLPWIADFRDPWLDNFSSDFATPIHYAICARLERNVVSAADRVSGVSKPMHRRFLGRYPKISTTRFVVLPNGFDPADFDTATSTTTNSSNFTLVYTGSLYGNTQSARPFLSAVKQITDNQRVPRNDFRVCFVGNTGKEAQTLVDKWGLSDVVELTAYLPHREMISHQRAANALLLIIGAGPGSEAVYTGKIFEYLAAGKPVLGLVPPGVAADLLSEAGVGRIVPPDNPQAIASALKSMYEDWQAGRLAVAPRPEVVARYDRRRLTGQLAGMLNAICEDEQ